MVFNTLHGETQIAIVTLRNTEFGSITASGRNKINRRQIGRYNKYI